MVLETLAASSNAAPATPQNADFQIYVRTSGRMKITLWVEACSTVDRVLAMCGDWQDLTPGQQRLAYGEVLLEGSRTLADYSVGEFSKLKLVDTPGRSRKYEIGAVQHAAFLVGMIGMLEEQMLGPRVPREWVLGPPLRLLGPPVPKASLVIAQPVPKASPVIAQPVPKAYLGIWRRLGVPVRDTELAPMAGSEPMPRRSATLPLDSSRSARRGV